MTSRNLTLVLLIGAGLYAGYNFSKTTDEFAKEYFGTKYDQMTRMRR